MPCITAVREQNVAAAVLRRPEFIQAAVGQFLCVIAEAVYLKIPLREKDGRKFGRRQEGHLRAERETCIGGAGPDKIVVARDQDDLRAGQRREEIIGVLQLPLGRRRVKKIPGNEQEIDVLTGTDLRKAQQRSAHGIRPGKAPGLVLIRQHAEMQIGGMDETHGFPPSKWIYLYYILFLSCRKVRARLFNPLFLCYNTNELQYGGV